MRPVLKRRSFLKAAGFVAAPTLFRESTWAEPAFHLHPHYREQAAIDSAVAKIKGEPFYDQIAPVLDSWRTALLEAPFNLGPVRRSLHPDFAGVAWEPKEHKQLREESAGITVQELHFEQKPQLPAAAFISSMQSALAHFSKLLTVELQVTSPTLIRYELVGTGDGFYREQRIGYWMIHWQDGLVAQWQMEDEVRSRSAQRIYADITRSAFGANEQLSHGADYWRTVLDGASGIDIYGHNGVSVGDIDGDGFDDVYVCQPAGLPNRLYRNKGDGTFEDITEHSGVGLFDNTACALFADFSNRGRQDLLVVRNTGPLLFENQGSNKFALKPNAFKFANPPQGTFTGASAADYNRDGWLDVYFCLYTYYQGTDQYKYPTPYFAAENGPPNFLMHNNGDGTFHDVTARTGLNKNNTRYSFCCGWADYNNDGWPDLYVVNDFGKKNLYRNNGDGTFTDVAAPSGVEDVGAGMSVSWLDYNNNGKPDLYVANMWTAAGERISSEATFQTDAPADIRSFYRKHAMGNSLFVNDGQTFSRTPGAQFGRWAWSGDAWDFDHDGFVDIYVSNGMITGPIKEDLNSFFWREVIARSPNTFKSDSDYEQGWNSINELIRSDYSWSAMERNVLFANNHDGTFCDISGVAGLDFIEDSRSFALADFDGDGRLEVLVKNRNAPQLRLMKTLPADLPPSISFRLRGTQSNRDAIGALVTVDKQTRSLQAGSGFLSQHSKVLHFGLGRAKGPVSATIRWPGGTTQTLMDLPINHRISVIEGDSAFHAEPFKPMPKIVETQQPSDLLPETFGSWLLTPVLAPKFRKAGLITFQPGDSDEDILAVYNLLFRSLFDRHHDMTLPASFLLNEKFEIVKVYQGPVNPETMKADMAHIPLTDAERLSKSLPFPGVSTTYEFGRNYLSLGSLFFRRGYPEYAEDFFQAALKQDAGSAEAFYGLGSVYLKQGKNNEAQQNFESAVRLTASYPGTTANAWNNLGLLATRDGNTPKAIGYFEQAIQADPNHFISLENLGIAYKQQKQFNEARNNLEKALSIKPNDAEANYNLGMVYAQMDDSTNAFAYLTKALKARPDYPEALNNLGILYLRTHRRDQAVASFQKSIEIAPGFEQSYLNLARVYAIEGSNETARSVLNALLAQHPDSAMAKQALSQLP